MKRISYIGIDAGGSKWEAHGKLVDIHKSLIITGVNARLESQELTADRLGDLVKQIGQKLGFSDEVRICAGLAGAASNDAQKALQMHLSRALSIPAGHISIVSDARVAFQAAFPLVELDPKQVSILVIAGTGSGCYSFGPNEEFFRSGGWGSVLGDPGSGTAIGTAAVRHLMASIESGQFTLLDLAVWKEMTHALGSPTDQEVSAAIIAVLDNVYESNYKLSNLAPIVLERLSTDPDSREMVQIECNALAIQVARLAERLHATTPEVQLTGGLSNNLGYLEAFQNAIHASIPDAIVSRATRKPAQGALDIALQMR